MFEGGFEALRVRGGGNDAKEAHRRALLESPQYTMNLMAEPDEEQAPIFGTWRRLYAAVAVYLFFLIVLFYAFTVKLNRPR